MEPYRRHFSDGSDTDDDTGMTQKQLAADDDEQHERVARVLETAVRAKQQLRVFPFDPLKDPLLRIPTIEEATTILQAKQLATPRKTSIEEYASTFHSLKSDGGGMLDISNEDLDSFQCLLPRSTV